MGRQIQVAATYIDELDFLSFLKSSWVVVIFESFAPTQEGLWKESFEPELLGHGTYYIWNRDFEWQPEYSKTIDETKYYIVNQSDAPILEFGRSEVSKGKYGRLYWAKYFSAPNGHSYDVENFAKWCDLVTKWVLKNSSGTEKYANINTYFQPNAWAVHKEIKLEFSL